MLKAHIADEGIDQFDFLAPGGWPRLRADKLASGLRYQECSRGSPVLLLTCAAGCDGLTIRNAHR
ncbi:MAG TPA: hypothetical protein VEP90_00805, partial [Methylomirabilota bacterium]|nr:hypothetical protein [Methylomirabilota bacterium]